MELWQIVVVVILSGLLAVVVTYLISAYLSGKKQFDTQIHNLVAVQRGKKKRGNNETQEAYSGMFDRSIRPQNARMQEAFKEGGVERRVSSRLTLEKKLKYAGWNMSPIVFRGIEVLISISVFLVVRQFFNPVLQGISLLSGPLFMNWLLLLFMEKRYKAFDADYAQMLLSLVGLLKTGLNPISALEAAAKGLDDNSLVKKEIELMIERLRFGVPEDKSIGAFGEDIYHPEIELFVQALLLSRRVGGNLSDTLERLAKQVRKRQYFRNSAIAAVSLQRGSIWFILAILCGLEGYLYIIYPQAVVGAIQDEIGWQAWQLAIVVILLGIFWIRQVTKIKI